ncbi:RNA-directed DNA polymerase from mobile element jockey [Araneus ventricosus]|uniref:RNA-directed DNA polymerase from mobile element jockey n=1 Tax=Araneus ventricosus TaxID=182803 RepID=A0A4Y2A6A2_ARAVE|nr:RNA-directed DNA polymerase from mobile element jockey [Araneus ventricosus]
MLRHLNTTSHLLFLFNRIWTDQKYPSQWHEAIVIAILKPGKNPSNPLHCRSIALTSCLRKTFERMNNARLIFELEKQGCISPFQSGFRRGRSTFDNLALLETQIRNAHLGFQQNEFVRFGRGVVVGYLTGFDLLSMDEGCVFLSLDSGFSFVVLFVFVLGRCTNDKRCKNCGGSHNECSDVPIKCFRCGQAHDALSKECSFFLIEKEIINLVRDKDISFNEARKKVNSQTYAQIARDHSSDKNSVKSGKKIADLREAVKELSNIVSSLIPKVNDIAKLQEVNRQCVEIQINLDRQVGENLNLKKHIDAQRATIESLQSKIAVLESNLEYNSIPSPIVGDDQRTPSDLNQFRVVSDRCDLGLRISLSLPPSEVESLAVKIWLGPNSETPIMIINIYSPGGDFNIHHPALGSSHTSTDAVSVLDWIGIRHMCVLNMNRFTRYQGTHVPSLLDLTICSADIVNNISLEVSHDMYDSDHCPILLSLYNFGIKSKVTRKFINWGQFSERVNENLRKTDIISSIEDLTHIFKVSAGSSSYSFTRSAHQHSLWWDVKCNYLKPLKRKLLRKAKSYPSRANWIAYKNMAGTLRKYAKERKEKFWDNTCQETASSHQAFRIVKASSGTLTAPLAQANAIAVSLIKRPPEERIPLDFSPTQNMSSDYDNLNCSFSMREFQNSLDKTKNKSPGADMITKKMLSSLTDENRGEILNLFNYLWSNSTVPESWRIAKIIPILKPGKNPTEVSSYRPIALTSVLGKVFERMILARLLRVYLKNSFFSSFHAGFLPYKGCDSLTSVMLNKILIARARKKFIYGISFDIKVAYNNVWHDGVVFKLLQSGISGKMALWKSRFLQDRKNQT